MDNYSILICVAFFASILSGAFGHGGGTLLWLSILVLMPIDLAMPIFVAVQLSSDVSRTLCYRKSVHLSLVVPFTYGSVLAIILGVFFYQPLDKQFMGWLVGFIVILLTWKPSLIKISQNRKSGTYSFIGFVVSIWALLTGMGGLLVSPFLLKEGLNKASYVGTKSACQMVFNSGILLLFIHRGFDYHADFVYLCGLMLSVVIGTFIGKSILNRLNEETARIIIKLLITGFAFKLILSSLL